MFILTMIHLHAPFALPSAAARCPARSLTCLRFCVVDVCTEEPLSRALEGAQGGGVLGSWVHVAPGAVGDAFL